MSTDEQSTRGGWSEVLLSGAAAGVGAPFLLKGLRRFLHLGQGRSPAGVGWTAGLLGALVAGGLARRRRQQAPGAERTGRPGDASFEASGPDATPDVEAEALLVDWRREVRRRRLAALEPRAMAPPEALAHKTLRTVERGPRRGPSGREQPWHEELASTSG
jgi:hypothetical protein